MAHYRHTQIGWVIIAAILVGGGIAVAGVYVAGLPCVALGAAVFLAVVLLMFATLTVEVDDTHLVARFGPGPIKKRVALAEVRSFRETRTPWYFGWGIRWIPGGSLFNVSGLSSIELLLENGRRFRVGTDEPVALRDAIKKVVGEPEPIPAEESARHERRMRIVPLVLAAIVAAVALAVVGLMVAQCRPPVVTVGHQSFTVDSLFYADAYQCQGVTGISLDPALPRILARTNGFAMGGTLRGNFEVEGLGRGKLFVEHGHPPYVMVRLRQGFVAVNHEQADKTRQIFEDLTRACPGR